MADLPEDINICYLAGEFLAAVIDGSDADTRPDGVVFASLNVKVRALPKDLPVAHRESNKEIILVDIDTTTDEFGRITDGQGNPWIAFVAPSASLTPKGSAPGEPWKVTVTISGASGFNFPQRAKTFVPLPSTSAEPLQWTDIIEVAPSTPAELEALQAVLAEVAAGRAGAEAARDSAWSAAEAIEGLVATLPSPSGSDDTAAINAVLQTVEPYTQVKAVKGATYLLSAPLTLQTDGTFLDLTGASVELLTGSKTRIIQTPQTPVLSLTASTTAGSATVTTSTAIPSTWVGHSIVIDDAGGFGPVSPTGQLTGTAAMHVRIVSVSGTTLTVDRPSVLTKTDVAARVYRRLRDIKIAGGEVIRRAGNAVAGHNVVLERVDGFEVSGQFAQSFDSKYFYQFGDFTNGWVHDITLDTASDGIDLAGPGSDLVIERIYGMSGDDTISMLPMSEFSGKNFSNSTWGDLERITVREDYAGSKHHKIINISTTHAATCRDISIDGVFGASPGATVKIMGWQQGGEGAVQTGPDLKHGRVSISRVRGTVGVEGLSCILVNNDIELLMLNDIEMDPASNPVDTVRVEFPATVVARNIKGTRILSVRPGGVGSVISIDGGRAIGTSGTYAIQANASCELSLTNIDAPGVANGLEVYGTGVNVKARLSGFRAGSTAAAYVRTSASLTVDGDAEPIGNVVMSVGTGATGDSALIHASKVSSSTAGAGTLFSRRGAVRANVSQLGKRMGDRAWNTSSALSCGAGPVISDGTLWKHEVTGATYTPTVGPAPLDPAVVGNYFATRTGAFADYMPATLAATAGTAVSSVPSRVGATTPALAAPGGSGTYPTVVTGAGAKKGLAFVSANSQTLQSTWSSAPGKLLRPFSFILVLKATGSAQALITGIATGETVAVKTGSAGTTLALTSSGGGASVTKPYATTTAPYYVYGVTAAADGSVRIYGNSLTSTAAALGTTAAFGGINIARDPSTSVPAYADMELYYAGFNSTELSDATMQTAMTDIASFFGITLS